MRPEHQNSGGDIPPDVGASSSSGRDFDGNTHNASGTRIKLEQYQPNSDPDLDDILEQILGESLPTSSTPVANRTGTRVNFATGGSAEPSPIARVEQPASSRITPRALFQNDSVSQANTTSCRSTIDQGTPTPTPTKQPTLQDVIQRMAAAKKGNDSAGHDDTLDDINDEGTFSSTTTTTTTRTTSSTSATGQSRKGTKRGKSGSSKAGPKPKKCKNNKNQPKSVRAAPASRGRGRRSAAATRLNDSGFGADIPNDDESRSSDTLDSYSMSFLSDEDDMEELSVRDTIPHFSIHRLPVQQLRIRFEDDSLTEIQIIEQIIDEVNNDVKKRYKDRHGFEERETPNNDTERESETNGTFDFLISAYIQKVERTVPLLTKLGIEDKIVDFNILIFYYRPNDIYALTVGQTWQAIQRYSCYDFPCHVSGRLTSAEGNVEETRKHIAGNVRISKATKKNASMLDQLKNVRLNVTKEVRSNSSLYRLAEFSEQPQQRSQVKKEKGKIRMQMGLAYVRIRKRIDLKNLPQILDHFSKIVRGENTYTFPDGRVEKHIDEFPPIRPLQHEESTEVESSFFELIQKFMHNERADLIKKFDFVDKHIDDFCNAEEFKLIYDNGGDKCYDIKAFEACPTALEVLTAIRAQCGDDIAKNGLQLRTFSYRLKNHVKVQYKVRGKGTNTQRKIVDLLEGEMSLRGKDYYKTMGQWWSVREVYYYNVYKEFGDLLNKPGLYVDNLYLSKPWNRNEIKTVQDYVKLYENEMHYFSPPTQQVLEELSSQGSIVDVERVDNESDIGGGGGGTEGNRYFDMMRICKNEDGNYAFWLFYIFDSFDSGIRDASTRIIKSIEMLLKDAPTTSSRSLLEKFWEYHIRRSGHFAALFHEYEMFRLSLTNTGNVSIVVAFATSPRQEALFGPLDRYVSNAIGESASAPATLDREKQLRLYFNLDNVRELLYIIDVEKPQCIDEMCKEVGINTFSDSESQDLELLTTKVMGLITDKKYCVENDAIDADKPVTGKLLKIRDYTKFKLFANDNLNKVMYETLRIFYITGFPGFTHKLECFQIYENVVREARLQLNFVEIK